jgi:hypothetical protein
VAGASQGGGQSSGGHAGTGGVAIGASGIGGDAGASEVFDAGPAVLNPNLDFLDEDVVVRATVALIACGSDDGFYDTLGVVRGVQDSFSYPGGRAFIECAAAVTEGCEGVRACYGLSDVQGTETCNTCQDNVAVFCGVDLTTRWNCDQIGATCQDGYCLAPGEELCDGTFDAECDGEGRPLSCDDIVRIGPRCADFGLTCQVDDFGIEAQCQGTGGECQQYSEEDLDLDPVGTGCDGDVMHACVYHRQDNVDCRNFGPEFTCQSFGDSFFCGTASECDPRTHEYTCEGSEVVFCDAGQLIRIDCTTLGFSECVEGVRDGVCQ